MPVDPLLHNVPIVDAAGRPTAQFSRLWMQARGVDTAVGAAAVSLSGLETGFEAHAAATAGVHGIADTTMIAMLDTDVSFGVVNASEVVAPFMTVGTIDIFGQFYPPAPGVNFNNLGSGAPLTNIPSLAPVCINLDADLLDGLHAAAFATAVHNHAAADINSGNLDYLRLPTGSGSWDVGSGNQLTLTQRTRMSGLVGVGVDPTSSTGFNCRPGTMAGTTQIGATYSPQWTTAATAVAVGLNIGGVGAASGSPYTTTLMSLARIQAPTRGSNQNLTTLIGLQIEDLTGIAAGTRWAIDTAGTTPSRFGGAVTLSGALDHDGTTAGLYGVAPVTRAAAITAPTGGATIDAESRTAINAIRTALTNIGITS
jgi:hypothetical protein